MYRRFSAALMFALVSLLGAGCTQLPSYQLHVSAPHKDVLSMVIYLEERTEADTYRKIAARELNRLRADAGRQWPLYEVRFEFHKLGSPSEKLARVVARLADDVFASATELAHAIVPRMETTVY